MLSRVSHGSVNGATAQLPFTLFPQPAHHLWSIVIGQATGLEHDSPFRVCDASLLSILKPLRECSIESSRVVPIYIGLEPVVDFEGAFVRHYHIVTLSQIKGLHSRIGYAMA